MSKAEEAAYKAYPYNGDYRGQGDSNSKFREAFIEGYSRAEKDNKLTWKDMELIYEISRDVFNEQNGHFYNVSKIWKEILKRFEERKQQ